MQEIIDLIAHSAGLRLLFRVSLFFLVGLWFGRELRDFLLRKSIHDISRFYRDRYGQIAVKKFIEDVEQDNKQAIEARWKGRRL